MKRITEKFAAKVLFVVDKGLVSGIGQPVPGKMCVEAAVAYAAGEDHNDRPQCVDDDLASMKIDMNDSFPWSSDKARAAGLRRIAIAQLGSRGKFDRHVFNTLLNELWDAYVFGLVLKCKSVDAVRDIVDESGSVSSVDYPFNDLNGLLDTLHPDMNDDARYTLVAEFMVQALIKMKIPGTKYLYLTEKKQRRAVKTSRKKRR